MNARSALNAAASTQENHIDFLYYLHVDMQYKGWQNGKFMNVKTFNFSTLPHIISCLHPKSELQQIAVTQYKLPAMANGVNTSLYVNKSLVPLRYGAIFDSESTANAAAEDVISIIDEKLSETPDSSFLRDVRTTIVSRKKPDVDTSSLAMPQINGNRPVWLVNNNETSMPPLTDKHVYTQILCRDYDQSGQNKPIEAFTVCHFSHRSFNARLTDISSALFNGRDLASKVSYTIFDSEQNALDYIAQQTRQKALTTQEKPKQTP